MTHAGASPFDDVFRKPMEVAMKKWPMLFSAVLFACGSFVAKAESGLVIPKDMSSIGDDARGEHEPPENALARGDHEEQRAFVVFGSMIGVDGSFLGADVRGIVGDATARDVRMARGLLGAGGKLLVIVRGLLPAAGGTNDQAMVRGLVSCLSEKAGGGGTMTVNVMTDPFPASVDGNAQINGSVQLPAQCLAPIIFVTNEAGDKWLAVMGTQTSATATP